MERLTARSKEGRAYVNDSEYEFVEDELWKAVDRLAEYEDLEEQNMLVKLPCRVGDVVYYLELNLNEIHKMRVQGMSINYNGLLILHLGDWVAAKASEFGKLVFYTKGEAEKALQEIGK
jgi:hypothetical protein